MDTITLWKHFQHLRELEISNLWKRSQLLGIFISILFGGYGVILLRIIDDDGAHKCIYHILALSLCSICLLFSVIWIMMSKSSKAWYEIYEKRIGMLEKELNIDNAKRYNYKGNNVMPNINNCIFSTKAGAYSPSRINIFIGIAMFWIWLIPFVLHSFYVFINIVNNQCCVCLKTLGCCILVLAIVGIPIFLFCYLRKSIKSRYIRNNKL